MKIERCTAAIMLLVLLGALLSAAVADNGVEAIRLPSQGQPGCTWPFKNCPHNADGEVAAAMEAVREKSVAESEEDASPWKCCDLALCTRSFPPICRCKDKVKKCAKTCKNCAKIDGSNGASSRYICQDTYGKAGPPCTNKTSTAQGKAEAVREKSVPEGEEDASPWKCCDLALCTRSFPPICRCKDKVKKCAKTCKKCEKVDGSKDVSSRYMCQDTYGKAGPRCPKTVVADGHRGN